MEDMIFSGLTLFDRIILICLVGGLIVSNFHFFQKNKAMQSRIIQLEKETSDKLYSEMRFLRHINHILRTPLNGIVGVVQLMQAGALGRIPESYQEYLNLTLEGTKELTAALEKLEHYCNNSDPQLDAQYVRKAAQSIQDDPYIAQSLRTDIPEKVV